MKNRLLASLMFLVLGCAPGVFAHGDNVSDAEKGNQNKGRSLQELAAAFLVKSHQEKDSLGSEKKKLTREEKKELGFEFRHIISKYNLEHGAEKGLIEEGFLMAEKTPGLHDVIYKGMFEEIVKTASLQWLKNKAKVLEVLKKEEGFREGTRLLAKKINLEDMSLYELSEKQLLRVVENIFKCPNLTGLNLVFNWLGEDNTEGLKAIGAEIGTSKTLTSFNFHGNEIGKSPEGLKAIGAGIGTSKSLTSFNLGNNQTYNVDGWKAIAAGVGKSESLIRFDFICNDLSASQKKALGRAGFESDANGDKWSKKPSWDWTDPFADAYNWLFSD
jgi:hypothetical protein